MRIAMIFHVVGFLESIFHYEHHEKKMLTVAYQELTWVYTYSLQVPASLWQGKIL